VHRTCERAAAECGLTHRRVVHRPDGVETRPTLLGVWAHPDDEAYLSAGLMAQFARRGRVVVVTATNGEAGTNDPGTWPPLRLAAQRQRELRDSLTILGVDEVHMLGLPDGGCHHLDGTHLIAWHIRRVRPDVIVTFGPDGLTGHIDHRTISRWTTAARNAVRPEADLWYSTVTAEFHDEWGAVNDAANFFYPGQPDTPRTAIDELVHHAALADDLLDLKVAALAAHTTQTAALIERIGPATYREWWRTESFRRADSALDHLRFAELDTFAA
jgi:LmbE family N-acetylglucosaminyl deacetylase